MKRLTLFDIDKTLIKESTGHKEAFSEGFRRVYGIDTSVDIINTEGMTDQQIIIEVLKKSGLERSEIIPKIEECMRKMTSYFSTVKNSIGVKVLEGVPELLTRLEEHNFLMGLVTGNIEPIGRGKLERVRLDHYFKFGCFGNEDISRSNLVSLAIRRAEKTTESRIENAYLFGDTPKDVKAGNKTGITTIGVATGNYSRTDLENAGADYVIDNLRNTQEIKDIVSA